METNFVSFDKTWPAGSFNFVSKKAKFHSNFSLLRWNISLARCSYSFLIQNLIQDPWDTFLLRHISENVARKIDILHNFRNSISNVSNFEVFFLKCEKYNYNTYMYNYDYIFTQKYNYCVIFIPYCFIFYQSLFIFIVYRPFGSSLEHDKAWNRLLITRLVNLKLVNKPKTHNVEHALFQR